MVASFLEYRGDTEKNIKAYYYFFSEEYKSLSISTVRSAARLGA